MHSNDINKTNCDREHLNIRLAESEQSTDSDNDEVVINLPQITFKRSTLPNWNKEGPNMFLFIVCYLF